ncbi:alpha-N-acetylneuraminide alpha-2,8-sialyltransferase-like [Glandiceps talaboti]
MLRDRCEEKILKDDVMGVNSMLPTHSQTINENDTWQKHNLLLPNDFPQEENFETYTPSLPINSKKIFPLEERNSSSFIRNITELLLKPWKHNLHNRDRIRESLRSMEMEDFSLNKLHHPAGINLTLASQNIVSQMTSEIYNLLPEDDEFGKTSWKSCSLVGGSGIILNSSCGQQIDKSEAVFRMNTPPVKPFVKDAGNKTTLTTFNKSILIKRYKALGNSKSQEDFVKDMQDAAQDAYWYISMHATKEYFPYSIKAIRLLRDAGIKVLLMNPHHKTQFVNAWKPSGFNKYLTTGFYLTSIAITHCDQVQLYGFWPMANRVNGDTIPYHYYGDIAMLEKHDFSSEFLTLVELHRLGVIKLNINPCIE